MIDGKENGTLKSFADKSISSNGTDLQLPPYSNDNPSMEFLITAADVQEATYVDNGDGTATIRITPVETTNDKKFQGAQGKMFNVMEDVASTLADLLRFHIIIFKVTLLPAFRLNDTVYTGF